MNRREFVQAVAALYASQLVPGHTAQETSGLADQESLYCLWSVHAFPAGLAACRCSVLLRGEVVLSFALAGAPLLWRPRSPAEAQVGRWKDFEIAITPGEVEAAQAILYPLNGTDRPRSLFVAGGET